MSVRVCASLGCPVTRTCRAGAGPTCVYFLLCCFRVSASLYVGQVGTVVSYDRVTVFRLSVCCGQSTGWSILTYCIFNCKFGCKARNVILITVHFAIQENSLKQRWPPHVPFTPAVQKWNWNILLQLQLSCPALLCNLTCSQFWPGLSSFVNHSPLLLLPVLSIHCHHLTRRTRSSRSSRCSSRGTCPDAAFALTTVVWTAAVAPSVWAEPAGGAPGECSLSSPQAHLSLSLLVLFF